ncbi:hypothetical protein FS837_004288 [Tulasnella sp. UAMH 9824]|nr:hypothetical protein FS837_004288 [Tulasnella sp. UAMH 9824]
MRVMDQIRKALVPEFKGAFVLGKKRRDELMQEFDNASSKLWPPKLGDGSDDLQQPAEILKPTENLKGMSPDSVLSPSG